MLPRRCAREAAAGAFVLGLALWRPAAAPAGAPGQEVELRGDAGVRRVANPRKPVAQKCAPVWEREARVGGAASWDSAFGDVLAYAVARDGSLYVLDRHDEAVGQLSPDGTPRRRFGRRGRGPGEFERPYRIAVAGQDVYVFDLALQRLVRFDTAGRHVQTRAVPFSVRAHPFLATSENAVFLAGVSADPAAGFSLVHEFDSELEYMRSFGEPPQFSDSSSARYLATGPVEPDRRGGVWFAPVSRYELRHYDGERRLDLVVTRAHDFRYSDRPYLVREEVRPGVFRVRPDVDRAFTFNVDVDDRGRVWVFVRDNVREVAAIDVYDRQGRFLWTQKFPLQGFVPGKLGPDGRLYGVVRTEGGWLLERYRPRRQGGAQCEHES
jgi:hypothetical protein